jgi:hypothetical protein
VLVWWERSDVVCESVAASPDMNVGQLACLIAQSSCPLEPVQIVSRTMTTTSCEAHYRPGGQVAAVSSWFATFMHMPIPLRLAWRWFISGRLKARGRRYFSLVQPSQFGAQSIWR